MPGNIKYNRPELKRYRSALQRYERYVPMLKLKQRQLQLAITEVAREQAAVAAGTQAARERFAVFSNVLGDVAGVNVRALARPERVRYRPVNVAGVQVQDLDEVEFPPLQYSLFATAPWTDRVISELREISQLEVKSETLAEQTRILSAELQKIIQRVNLFEKVKVPEAREAIRRIRIHLGDAMAASVGRARIAKSKLAEAESRSQSQDVRRDSRSPSALEAVP